jgi:hypothetical protein
MPDQDDAPPKPKSVPPRNYPGRPKGRGLAERIRVLTGDGNAIINDLWRIWRGEVKGFGARERMKAAEMLFDRGWGRAIAPTTELPADSQVVSDLISPDALEALVKVLPLQAAPAAVSDGNAALKLSDPLPDPSEE